MCAALSGCGSWVANRLINALLREESVYIQYVGEGFQAAKGFSIRDVYGPKRANLRLPNYPLSLLACLRVLCGEQNLSAMNVSLRTVPCLFLLTA